MGVKKPEHCPGCGAKFDESDALGYVSRQEYYTDQYDATKGYDCYCGICSWSGNIEPDMEE
jgi:hypothetical protein